MISSASASAAAPASVPESAAATRRAARAVPHPAADSRAIARASCARAVASAVMPARSAARERSEVAVKSGRRGAPASCPGTLDLGEHTGPLAAVCVVVRAEGVHVVAHGRPVERPRGVAGPLEFL